MASRVGAVRRLTSSSPAGSPRKMGTNQRLSTAENDGQRSRRQLATTTRALIYRMLAAVAATTTTVPQFATTRLAAFLNRAIECVFRLDKWLRS